MTARRVDSPGSAAYGMGDTVHVEAGGTRLRLAIAVSGAAGQVLEVWRDRQPAPVERKTIDREVAAIDVDLSLRPGGWVHAVLRDATGITAIGNPVFAR